MKSRKQGHLNLNPLPYYLLSYLIVLAIPANSQTLNSEWKFESQRAAIAPVSYIDSKTTFDGKATLTLKGGGKDYAAGNWYKVVDVQPETYYQFRTYFKSFQVDEPARSILAKVIWQNESGEVVGFREYPATLQDETRNGWRIISQSYKAPAEAKPLNWNCIIGGMAMA
jgi:hypothetical protein